MKKKQVCVCMGITVFNVLFIVWFAILTSKHNNSATQNGRVAESDYIQYYVVKGEVHNERKGKPLFPQFHSELDDDTANALAFQPFNMSEDKYQGLSIDKLPRNFVTNQTCKTQHCTDVVRDLYLLLDNTNLNTDVFLKKDLLHKPLGEFGFIHEGDSFNQFMINTTLSEQLPLVRTLPNKTPELCANVDYNEELLSKVSSSVIIPFHNEACSVLLRTIHGILFSTPASLVKEVLLVDDNSTNENLGTFLVQYLKQIPKIKLLKTYRREGLIRARMLGAKMATGDILVFLDAHVEFSENWLEPLVHLLYHEPNTIAIPSVHGINPLTMEGIVDEIYGYGTFSWELDYVWRNIPPDIAKKGTVDPIPTQTSIGCTMAFSRHYFFKYGGFDEGMHIWGGENLEMSFRTWMCGGAVKIVPCSNVWHIFRSHLPYSIPDEDAIDKNLQRLAMVWMDNYAKYYYLTSGKIFDFNKADRESIQERKALRNKLGCKSFKTFLLRTKNSLLEIPSGALLFGQMKNLGLSVCPTVMRTSKKFELQLTLCTLVTKEQTFVYHNKQLVHMLTQQCLTMGASDKGNMKVILEPCIPYANSLQIWSFDPIVPQEVETTLEGVDTRRPVGSFRLRYSDFSLCLTVIINRDSSAGVTVQKCHHLNPNQYWVFTHKVNENLNQKIDKMKLSS